MPAQTPPTLAELAAQAAEIERQKAALQLPILTALKARLEQPDITALITELTEAQALLDEDNGKPLGFLVTTLKGVPTHVTRSVAKLDAIVNPPVVPTPPAPEG